jgi:alkylation response protein AidB-like acyl-CoA dehydrogenase
MDEALDTATLALLRESLERYGRERYGFEARAARLASAAAFGRDAWADYAAFGWLSMPLPAEDGGFGAAAEALDPLMQFVGRSLALEPVLASVVLCGSLLSRARGEEASQALRALAAGELLLALAHEDEDGQPAQVRAGRLQGGKVLVLHGDAAGRLLVSAKVDRRTGVFMVEAAQPGIVRSPYRLVDGRGAASFRFEAARAIELPFDEDAEDALAHALDAGRLGLCSEALGVCIAANAQTLAWLKERRQFGRPIGANQALQHRMVELYMLQEECRATLQAALRARGGGRTFAIAAALAHAIRAVRHVTHEAVQLHGGIGITEELAVSHWFRRAMVIGKLLGDAETQLRRFSGAPV